jgi:hypothetical protein
MAAMGIKAPLTMTVRLETLFLAGFVESLMGTSAQVFSRVVYTGSGGAAFRESTDPGVH